MNRMCPGCGVVPLDLLRLPAGPIPLPVVENSSRTLLPGEPVVALTVWAAPTKASWREVS